jgi:hypothetical protein
LTNNIETFNATNQWNITHKNGVVTTGLVCHLDAAAYSSGSTWTDLSGNGTNGTLILSPTYNTAFGGYFSFNGVDQCVELGEAAQLNPAVNITWAIWFRSSLATSGTLIRNRLYGGGISVSADGGVSGNVWNTVSGNVGVSSPPNSVVRNTWYNLVGTFRNGVFTLYLNGVQFGSIAATANAMYYLTPYTAIGRDGQGTGGFSAIDVGQVMIYDRGLTTEEVQQNYRALMHRFGTPPVPKAYPNARAIKQENPIAESGIYPIIHPVTGVPQPIYCDMETDGGGWMLIASNDARDATIPNGTGRHSIIYEVDRPTPLIGTQGISPNGDYIIGEIVQYLPYNQARIWAWGYGSVAGSFSNTHPGTDIKAIWNLKNVGPARLTEVTPRASVSITTSRDGSLSSSASYFALDGVKLDRINGGFSANTDQTTIGGVGTAGASGDPTTGCYLGHGSGGELTSNEGWYNAANSASNCQGYTTWVR